MEKEKYLLLKGRLIGMSEEEKEVIKYLKGIDVKFFINGSIECSNFIIDEANKTNNYIDVLLNLIEKQQSKITKLEEENEMLKGMFKKNIRE